MVRNQNHSQKNSAIKSDFFNLNYSRADFIKLSSIAFLSTTPLLTSTLSHIASSFLGSNVTDNSNLHARTFSPSTLRVIPKTGEKVNSVGLGTWQVFDCLGQTCIDKLSKVYRVLASSGGMIDSSPMYGNSEETIGKIQKKLGYPKGVFFATKVWTRGKKSGEEQIKSSMKKMAVNQLDLLQIHNLLDYKTHSITLAELKEKKVIRYTGITHYMSSSFNSIEKIMKTDPIDFIQIPLSVTTTEATKRILPLAGQKGIAVIINLPFGGGGLFHKVRNRPLPKIAIDLHCTSWAQLFLKYILSFPDVTTVIPATTNPKHMAENIAAAKAPLPNDIQRKKIISVVNEL